MSTGIPDTPRPVLPGEDEKYVTLREYEQRHSDLKNLMLTLLGNEKETRETITEKLEEARALQAEENLRRLSELNHAHSQAQENWAQSLPREVFSQWKDEHDKWRETVTLTLAAIVPNAQQIAQIDARLRGIEQSANKISGAFYLVGMMGMAGVLAFFMSVARMMGLLT